MALLQLYVCMHFLGTVDRHENNKDNIKMIVIVI